MKIKCNICRDARTQILPNIEKVNDEQEIFCYSCCKFLSIAEKYTYQHKWAIDKKYTLIIN